MSGTTESQSISGQPEQTGDPIDAPASPSPSPSPVVTKPEPQFSREEVAAEVVASPFELPSPVAWFRVFNKLGSPRWRQLCREPASITIADRHKAALALGAILTDVYIAVESRGSQEVRDVLLNVRTLEKTLGISERMQQRHSRLGGLADAGQWLALRVDLDAMMAEQTAVLREQRDGPLADLLPIGMLLRTIRVGCDLVTELALEDKRICIGDVMLVIALIKKVESLPERTLKERSVRDARRCLKNVRDYWSDDWPGSAEAKVAETQARAQEFLDSLLVNE